MRTVPVLTTCMEMTERPAFSDPKPPVEGISIERVRNMTPAGYRELYTGVGGPYRWYDRILMDDGLLCEILGREDNEIYLVKVDDSAVGYFEIDRKDPEDVEITYLGLVQRFHGMGLGSYVLHVCLDIAWGEDTNRVWLHTCEWDHPAAIPMYERAGFRKFRTVLHLQKVPHHGSEPYK